MPSCLHMRRLRLRALVTQPVWGGGGLLGVHALNLGAIASGSPRGHPIIDLLGGLDHPGQAGLFPV